MDSLWGPWRTDMVIFNGDMTTICVRKALFDISMDKAAYTLAKETPFYFAKGTLNQREISTFFPVTFPPYRANFY